MLENRDPPVPVIQGLRRAVHSIGLPAKPHHSHSRILFLESLSRRPTTTVHYGPTPSYSHLSLVSECRIWNLSAHHRRLGDAWFCDSSSRRPQSRRPQVRGGLVQISPHRPPPISEFFSHDQVTQNSPLLELALPVGHVQNQAQDSVRFPGGHVSSERIGRLQEPLLMN